MHKGFKVLIALVFALLLVSTGVGLYLVATYNMSTSYASVVPTATQTVAVRHGSNVRYMAPDIAFRLNLGLWLSGLSWAGIVFGSIVLRRLKDQD